LESDTRIHDSVEGDMIFVHSETEEDINAVYTFKEDIEDVCNMSMILFGMVFGTLTMDMWSN